jgi:hypothetical protein
VHNVTKRILVLLLTFFAACGDGRLSPQGGTITGVTAGDGLTGGGLSGIVTLNVACGYGLTCLPNSIAVDNTVVVDGTGTLNYVPLWTPDGNTLGNSIVAQDVGATAATVNGDLFVTDPTGNGAFRVTTNTGKYVDLTVQALFGTATLTATDTLIVVADNLSLDTNPTGAVSIGSSASSATIGTATYVTTTLDVGSTARVHSGLSGGTIADSFQVGNLVSSTTSADTGFSVGMNRTDGNVTWDTKLGTTGSLYGRVGAGTSNGYTNTWLQVGGAGDVTMYGSLTSGDAAGDVFDHNGDVAKFGSADGAVHMENGELNFAYATNATASGYISWSGYQGGATQFRDTVFGNGKEAVACTLTGSTKVLNCVGGLQVNGTSVNTFNTSNTIPKGNGTTLTASSWTDDGTTSTTSTHVVASGGQITAGYAIDNGVDGQNSVKIQHDSGTGVALIMAKVTSTKELAFTIGEGTTAGYNFTWLSVDGTTGSGTFNAETVIAGGTVGGNSTNGIHFGFASNTGTISSTQPGTANRELTIQGTPLNLAVGGTTEIAISGSAVTISDPTTIGDSVSGDSHFINGTTTITAPSGAGLTVQSTAQANVIITGDSNNAGADDGYTGTIIYSAGSQLWYIGRDGLGNTDGLIFLRASSTVDMAITTAGLVRTSNDFQAGDASTDLVGIGIAPSANATMTFANVAGDKIHMYPVSGTEAYGLGVGLGVSQYFVPNGAHHSFGYGDSGAFTVAQMLDYNGQVFFGETANTDTPTVNTNSQLVQIINDTSNTSDITSGTYVATDSTNTISYGSSSTTGVIVGGRFTGTATRDTNCETCGSPATYGVQGVATYSGEYPQGSGGGNNSVTVGVYGASSMTDTTDASISNAISYGGYFTATGEAATKYAIYGGPGAVLFEGATTLQSTLNVQAAVDFDSTLNVDGQTTLRKVYTSGSTPSLSSCGTSPTIVGNDTAGTVTTGTGSTGCTVTFASAFATNAPICVMSGRSATAWPYPSSVSTSAFTVNNNGTGTSASYTFDYHCVGRI